MKAKSPEDIYGRAYEVVLELCVNKGMKASEAKRQAKIYARSEERKVILAAAEIARLKQEAEHLARVEAQKARWESERPAREAEVARLRVQQEELERKAGEDSHKRFLSESTSEQRSDFNELLSRLKGSNISDQRQLSHAISHNRLGNEYKSIGADLELSNGRVQGGLHPSWYRQVCYGLGFNYDKSHVYLNDYKTLK